MTTPPDINAVKAAVAAASEELSGLCKGSRRFVMSVPVRDTDTDMVIREALNGAEALLAEVERLREQTRWIPVEERLPEANIIVLGWLDGQAEHSGVSWGRRGIALLVRHPDEPTSVTNGWAWEWFENARKRIDADAARVTHWRPIPSPPETTDTPQDEGE